MAAKDMMERDFAVRGNLTPNGKKLQIMKVPNTALYRVAFSEGGELPKELQGMWTAPYTAQRSIETYLDRRWNEHESKATKKASS